MIQLSDAITKPRVGALLISVRLMVMVCLIPGSSAVQCQSLDPVLTLSSKSASETRDCKLRLESIHKAIKKFEFIYDRKPHWLSELAVEGILGTDLLICPTVKHAEDYLTSSVTLEGDVFDDPHPYITPTYAYEFCEAVIPLWPGLKITHADYKMAQRQIEEIGDRVPIVRCTLHKRLLNLALSGEVYESGKYWEDEFRDVPHTRHIHENLYAHHPPKIDPAQLPRRAEAANPNQIDLSTFYNASLDTFWLPRQLTANLKSLSKQVADAGGLLSLEPNGVQFDARGILQIDAKSVIAPYPKTVPRIPLPHRFTHIHILHAASGRKSYQPKNPKGTCLAEYHIHYNNGDSSVLPILFGETVGMWIFDPDHFGDQDIRPVWRPPSGTNLLSEGLGMQCGLYLTSWKNPHPNEYASHLSISTRMADSGVFIVAITAQLK